MFTSLQWNAIYAQGKDKDADHSVSELREMLQKCLKTEMTTPGVEQGTLAAPYAYVNEIYPESKRFVYSTGGQNFMRSYTLKNGKCSLKGDARPARQQWMGASADRHARSFEMEHVRAYGTSEGVSKAWESRPRKGRLAEGVKVHISPYVGGGKGEIVSTAPSGHFHQVKLSDGTFGYYHESDLKAR